MAIRARYTYQMPFVGTATQRWAMERAATPGYSLADVCRNALDAYFNLDDGELPDDDTRQEDFQAWLREDSRS